MFLSRGSDESCFMVWGFLRSNVQTITEYNVMLLQRPTRSFKGPTLTTVLRISKIKICHFHAKLSHVLNHNLHTQPETQKPSPSKLQLIWSKSVHMCVFICVCFLSGDKHTCEIKVCKTQERGHWLELVFSFYSSKPEWIWVSAKMFLALWLEEQVASRGLGSLPEDCKHSSSPTLRLWTSAERKRRDTATDR